MKKYIIEVEEKRAEAVINLLAEISIKVDKTAEGKEHYVYFCDESRYVALTEEQYNFLVWLTIEIYDCNWVDVDPDDIFEEI